jgi:septal ring factor EnvC (AmiA/AmiB activator)
MAALMAQQDKAIASIDSQIEQLQIKLAEVNADIEALQAGG